MNWGRKPFRLGTGRTGVTDVYTDIYSTTRAQASKTRGHKRCRNRKLTRPLKMDYFNRKYIFQPLIFRGHVSFPGSIFPNIFLTHLKMPPSFWTRFFWFFWGTKLMSSLSKPPRRPRTWDLANDIQNCTLETCPFYCMHIRTSIWQVYMFKDLNIHIYIYVL